MIILVDEIFQETFQFGFIQIVLNIEQHIQHKLLLNALYRIHSPCISSLFKL